MKRLLIPLVLLLLGVGGGVGAGLFLAPPEPEPIETPCGPVPDEGAAQDGAAEAGHEEAGPAEGAPPAHDYVKLNNQFIVPILSEGQVASLVMLSLSVETQAGKEEAILMVEPKLRDLFLQVLFDHANTGGFDGLFTAASAMRDLRQALLDAAQASLGQIVSDVLITDIVRQDQ